MTSKHFLTYSLVGWLLCLVSACYYPHSAPADGWAPPEGWVDSAQFAATHHYAHNFNFRIVADSLPLADYPAATALAPLQPDTLWLKKRDKVVVADIMRRTDRGADTIWVKVARDQATQGWVSEQRLLQAAIPDDPISSFIYHFSSTRLISFLVVAVVVAAGLSVRLIRRRGMHFVHFNDIHSFYPTLQCLCISGAAALYGSVQVFVPDTWVEFYYHPTLNPFVLPPILALFILSVWTNVIVALAVVDDVRRRLPLGEALAYLLGLLGVCVVLYLVFTLTVGLWGLGYALLCGYWFFALRSYFRQGRYLFRCGRCGAELQRLGRCPHCGAINK